MNWKNIWNRGENPINPGVFDVRILWQRIKAMLKKFGIAYGDYSNRQKCLFHVLFREEIK